MNLKNFLLSTFLICCGGAWVELGARACAEEAQNGVQRRLYVATPGVRNYLEYGGHGLLVFNIDDGHKFVKRIPLGGLREDGTPDNVKGICASAETGRIYVSTISTMMCLDLYSEELLWEKRYEGGCDRMAISPDGKIIYLPSFEKDHWHVVDALSGEVIALLSPKSKAHNTVYGPDGNSVYMAGLGSPLLSVAETTNHTIARTVGPFTQAIRPFTVNGSQTLVFCCVNDCLGFEIGDLTTGKMIHRVEVEGYSKGAVKRHGCPSHGIGMTPDEREVWVCDSHNQRVHAYDVTVMPPRLLTSIVCRDEPGWVTFSIDGSLAWPSPGEVVDVKTKQIIAHLTDEEGRAVASEKLIEVDWLGDRVTRVGCQFGIGGQHRQVNAVQK